ncbi:hypothetical protein PybrP1_000466 [[Pythium] brassicae (nom. inval.)]|nr:hypothetical protein PybrP1_000466 [[Pythium] brassicae (nom. inval.)]
MDFAASTGSFEKLLFLKQAGIDRYTSRVVFCAAEENHFEIFQWLRANYSGPTMAKS